MNTTRRVAQHNIVLTILVGAALVIGLAGCGEQKPPEAPLVDNGPNAGLSNAELVSLAITNMTALKSYHFEFQGGLPSMSVRMSSNLSITGDVQLYGTGAR
jgi:hypothetical protein